MQEDVATFRRPFATEARSSTRKKLSRDWTDIIIDFLIMLSVRAGSKKLGRGWVGMEERRGERGVNEGDKNKKDTYGVGGVGVGG